MKSSFSIHTHVLPIVVSTLALSHASRAIGQGLDDSDDTSGWVVRVGGMARFNVKASLSAPRPQAPAGYYNDGFVLPDSGGVVSGKTWNWGYNDSAKQSAGTDIAFHRYDNVPAVGTHEIDPGLVAGGEFIGGYEFSGFTFLNRPARIGFELGYAYSPFSQNMGYTSHGSSTYTTDTYSLNGVVAPQSPYSGTFTGPGPLLSLNNDNRTLASSDATTVFAGRVRTELQNIRVGPSFEVDLTKRLSGGLGLGYSSVYVDSALNYTETTSFVNAAVPGLASGSQSIKKADWEPGVYVELRANYQFSHYVGAFAGGDMQYNQSFEFGDAGHDVKIDLGMTYGLKAGLIFRF